MGLYQVATFGAMAVGSVLSGAAGEAFGIPATLAGFGIGGALGAWALRRLPMENPPPPPPPGADILHPAPESPDPGLAPVLARDALPVMESVRYLVPEVDRAEFLAAMREVRGVRMRAGAVNWRLYEDVAHPERFVELWTMESWTEHLREAGRMTDADAAILARAAALHRGSEPALAQRFLSLEP